MAPLVTSLAPLPRASVLRGGLWLAQVKLEGAFVDENALMVAQLGDGFLLGPHILRHS